MKTLLFSIHPETGFKTPMAIYESAKMAKAAMPDKESYGIISISAKAKTFLLESSCFWSALIDLCSESHPNSYNLVMDLTKEKPIYLSFDRVPTYSGFSLDIYVRQNWRMEIGLDKNSSSMVTYEDMIFSAYLLYSKTQNRLILGGCSIANIETRIPNFDIGEYEIIKNPIYINR